MIIHFVTSLCNKSYPVDSSYFAIEHSEQTVNRNILFTSELHFVQHNSGDTSIINKSLLMKHRLLVY